MLMIFPLRVITGLASRQQASEEEGSATTGLAPTCTQTCDFVSLMYEKLVECTATMGSYLPIVGAGLLVGTMTMCTLFVMTRFFDPEPYLYNKGKLGRLEAQSIYSSKKAC